jgi:hypothetical protein
MVLGAALIVACSAPKKATQTSAATSEVKSAKPCNGVYAPGEEELAAIQVRYKEVTIQTLSEGHQLYTGVCTMCHPAKNIYNYTEESWPHIMNNMAPKAKISAREKDAVYKYVLAIKAAKPKATN